jgi:3',5'-nucleoside bisphosphate phosphatase
MSDGSFSPAEVVKRAASLGLRAIAITDHDTVSGIEQATEQGRISGIEIIPGLEISTDWHAGILHILGYFVDRKNEALLSALDFLQTGRRDRIPRILAKLKESSNMHVSQEAIDLEAAGGVPGRPHVAKVMVREGLVETMQEAFDKYLGKGNPAYVKKAKLPAHTAIRVICEAGGIPVLAHPYSLDAANETTLIETVQALMDSGLQGIEAFYPKHTLRQTEIYLSVASRFGLTITGGTDFHGDVKPDIELGQFPQYPPMDYSILESLKSRLLSRENS